MTRVRRARFDRRRGRHFGPRGVRGLILVAIVVFSLVAVRANLSGSEASELVSFGIAPSSGGPDLSGAPAPSAGLARVVAAVVDIDTDLSQSHALGAGTGIVIDPSGLVLTNNHVIEGAADITGTDLGNGRAYAASVVGRDRPHDIALLRLRDAGRLPTAPFADASRVAIGDRVVGIGNAGGTGGRPSRAPGIVTAVHQTITAGDDLTGRARRLDGLIQIAAPIRHGDSGGPLVNTAGQVIGIDTAGTPAYRAENHMGEGFAIPIDQAVQIARQWRGT